MKTTIEKREEESGTATSTDQESFLSLIDRHQRMLLKVCWAYTRTSHDRDDLLQEIISRLWAAFGNYDRNRQFSTWMYRVALNVAIDYHRRRQRRETGKLSLADTHDPPSPQNELNQEQLQELHELLERQNEADRAILLLSLEGNTYREIAEIIGISESNVGTRLSRLKKTLRESVQSSQKV
ncbi:MAG TPA: RNA polymerase sigma factor, partial [Lacipirellulaceae bacterium]|nr:RNA polymerase sigma factor [Lacipirellulaceae bacterium]